MLHTNEPTYRQGRRPTLLTWLRSNMGCCELIRALKDSATPGEFVITTPLIIQLHRRFRTLLNIKTIHSWLSHQYKIGICNLSHKIATTDNSQLLQTSHRSPFLLKGCVWRRGGSTLNSILVDASSCTPSQQGANRNKHKLKAPPDRPYREC